MDEVYEPDYTECEYCCLEYYESDTGYSEYNCSLLKNNCVSGSIEDGCPLAFRYKVR